MPETSNSTASALISGEHPEVHATRLTPSQRHHSILSQGIVLNRTNEDMLRSYALMNSMRNDLGIQRKIAVPKWSDYENSLLASITGFFATQVEADAAGRISAKRLPWKYISAYMVTAPPKSVYALNNAKSLRRSPESCRLQWMKIFPNSFFVLTLQGVFLCREAPKQLKRRRQTHLQQRSNIKELSTLATLPGLNANHFNLDSTQPHNNQSHSSTKRKALRKPRKNWTVEEKRLIEEYQKQHGNKWTFIASLLPTKRTSTELKNYWHHLARKRRSGKR